MASVATTAPTGTTQAWSRALIRVVFGFPMLAAVLFAVLLLAIKARTTADPDLGWHLRNAEYIAQHHDVPRTDMYSFTARGQPWLDPEWLAELPFYAAWRGGGQEGIFLLAYGSALIILLGLFSLAARESHSVVAAAVATVLAVPIASVSFGPRTLLFGWMLLLVELAILSGFRDRPGWIWALPPLFLVWINTHGSWLIGLSVLGLFALSGCFNLRWGGVVARRWNVRQARKLAAVFALILPALLINPYGWRMPAYPLDFIFRQKLNVASVQEWQSLDFHSPRGKYTLCVLGLGIALQIVRRRTWKLHEVGYLLLALYAGLTYERFLFLAAILITPLLAKEMAMWLPRYRRSIDQPWANAVIIAACLMAMWWKIPTSAQLRRADAAWYPAGAQAYLEHFPLRGHLLNSYDWGGYLILHDRQIPVFVDSRADIFERNGILRDYLDLARLHGSLAILDKYEIRYLLLHRGSELAYLLLNTSGFKILYQDRTTLLVERAPGGSGRSSLALGLPPS